MKRRALLGLIGSSIGRSISPAMHEAAGAALGIDVRYHLIDTQELSFGLEDLPHMLDGVRRLGFAGVNVTHPFKEAVAAYLDGLEGAARIVGSVNTIVVRNGRLIGNNTDHSGFLAGWRRVFGDRKPGRVALVGAGGVGRAMAHGLAALGCEKLRVFDLKPERAAALVQHLRIAHPDLAATLANDMMTALADCDGIVNATPIGSFAYPGLPVPGEGLAGRAWAADAVYTPLETRFVAAARGARLAVLTGQELAIGQAVDAFACFFGQPAPAEIMRATFERELRRGESGLEVASGR
ncbi:MAG: shikimate dehydrogenase [Alphaproteobacteria bacterium]|nr:shikimate dehydrogenase [Alphaproteobacteria bacterium]